MISPELEARIETVVAMEEIKNLKAKYEYLADASEWDRIVDELFADDFEGAFSHVGGPFSKDDMRELYRAQSSAMFARMWHMIMTPHIEVDGDTARGMWYLLVAGNSPTPNGEEPFWLLARYNDDFARIDGEWKFTALRATVFFASPHRDGWVKTPFMEGYDSGARAGERPVIKDWLPS